MTDVHHLEFSILYCGRVLLVYFIVVTFFPKLHATRTVRCLVMAKNDIC